MSGIATSSRIVSRIATCCSENSKSIAANYEREPGWFPLIHVRRREAKETKSRPG